MDVTYTNCDPADLLSKSPRGVLHVTVARSARVLDWLTSASLSGRSWPDIVGDFSDRVGNTGLVFPLGAAYAPDGDSVGVVDMRVNDTLGIFATTIAQLVGRLNDLTAFCEVAAVELYPQVPGFGDGGPGALASQDVTSQIAGEAAADAQPNVVERTLGTFYDAGGKVAGGIGNAAGKLLTPIALAVAIPLALVAVILIFAPKGAKSLDVGA